MISVLKNPFYAGAYAYGKSKSRTAVVDGRAHKTYGHIRPLDEYDVLLKDHHEGYIDWGIYERNQKQLAINAYGQRDGAKSGRGGRSLLIGLMTCGQCGHRLRVAYRGRYPYPVYQCIGRTAHGLPRCMCFGGQRVDTAIARELMRVVQPIAIQAALVAERTHMETQREQQRILELELQQARYEASLAERRYAACDPDNRLIAAQLEKNWETSLRRVSEYEARLDDIKTHNSATPTPDFTGLAEDLDAAWSSSSVTMRTRQQLVRALINDITVNIDEADCEIVLTIHWKGGRHSTLRLRKPQSGEHECVTSDDALAIIESMASRWSDEHIAATLNRMGLPTAQGKSWTAKRVGSIRRVRGIHAYKSAEKDGEWLTLTEAAKASNVTAHRIRSLIAAGILPAQQVVPGAPYQINASQLRDPRVATAMRRKGRPCQSPPESQIPMFTDT